MFSFLEPGAEQTIEVIRLSGNPKIDKLVLIHTPVRRTLNSIFETNNRYEILEILGNFGLK